jgi:hypothetical protein
VWVSDGTDAETIVLEEQATETLSSSPAQLVISGKPSFFMADDGIHGNELWVKDLMSGEVNAERYLCRNNRSKHQLVDTFPE